MSHKQTLAALAAALSFFVTPAALAQETSTSAGVTPEIKPPTRQVPPRDPAYLGPPIREDIRKEEMLRTPTSGPTTTTKPGIQNLFRNQFEAVRQNFERKTDAINSAIEERRKTLLQDVESRREEVRANLEERRAAFREELMQRKEAIRESVVQRKELLKQRLGEVADERKAQIALRVDEQLSRISESRVTFFTAALDQIEAVLERVAGRAADASTRGVDVSAVTPLLSDAEEAIESARDAVATQASKDYTVSVSSESGIRGEFQAARDALKADLTALRDAVRAARDAVHAAAVALGQANGGRGDGPRSTTTTSTAPTTNE